MKLTYAVIMNEGPNNWAASSPDVPGCIATGDDIHEMRTMIRDAIAFHLECLAADGDPIPWPKITTPQEALQAEEAFLEEIAADFPSGADSNSAANDAEDGWALPIAEMIEVEVDIPVPTV